MGAATKLGFVPLTSTFSLPATLVEVLEPDPSEGVLVPVPTSSHSLVSGYYLRSSAKKDSGGLGKGKYPTSEGRGSVSYLAKAQNRAKMDVHDGKQQSIERALRAR